MRSVGLWPRLRHALQPGLFGGDDLTLNSRSRDIVHSWRYRDVAEGKDLRSDGVSLFAFSTIEIARWIGERLALCARWTRPAQGSVLTHITSGVWHELWSSFRGESAGGCHVASANIIGDRLVLLDEYQWRWHNIQQYINDNDVPGPLVRLREDIPKSWYCAEIRRIKDKGHDQFRLLGTGLDVDWWCIYGLDYLGPRESNCMYVSHYRGLPVRLEWLDLVGTEYMMEQVRSASGPLTFPFAWVEPIPNVREIYGLYNKYK